MKRLPDLLIAIALLVVGVTGLLASSPSAGAEDVYSERTLEIARQLNCPICSGESLADSQTELARQMRGIIEQKVQAGESDQQIRDYFVARYGESILADPPKEGFSLALWWMPVLVVALGALVVGLYLRERTPRAPGAARREETGRDESDPELEAIARDVLGGEGTART